MRCTLRHCPASFRDGMDDAISPDLKGGIPIVCRGESGGQSDRFTVDLSRCQTKRG